MPRSTKPRSHLREVICDLEFCVQVVQGLLWLWPEGGADAWLEASTKPPVTTPEMQDPAFAGAQADFMFMENPASLQVMLVRSYQYLKDNQSTDVHLNACCPLGMCMLVNLPIGLAAEVGGLCCRKMHWTLLMPHMCTTW